MEPFAQYGFRIRPLSEVEGALGRAGLSLVEHRPVGKGSRRFHVLVAAPRGADDAEGRHGAA